MVEKERTRRRSPLGDEIEGSKAPGAERDEVADRQAAAAEPPEAPPDAAGEENWADQLALKQSGDVRNTAANLILIFENHPLWKKALIYNERSLSIRWARDSAICGTKVGETLEEFHQGDIVVWLQNTFRISASLKSAYEAVITTARKNAFDPVMDWLKTLQWDGVDRLDQWLPDATGCVRSRYAIEIGSKWMISAVARALRPGCKVDAMLVLCGPQGTLKSTLLAKLAGPWFSDQFGEIGAKDTLLQIHGPWIIEMSELDAMRNREASAIKAFLTATVDRFRPPYGRNTADFPRRCVFSGTTNHETFLRDNTGGRRFWPIKIEEIDLEYIDKMRDQLWAEAAHRFAAGEEWWLSRDDEITQEAEEEQDRSRQIDPWEDKIASWIASGAFRDEISMSNVLAEGLNLDISKQDPYAATRAGFVLKRLKWTRHRKRVDGNPTWVYKAPIRAVDAAPEPTATPEEQGPSQSRLGEKY